MTMRLVNWNVGWATPRSQRTPEILYRIGQHTPDVVCLTKTHTGLLSPDGHVICSRPDTGLRAQGENEEGRAVVAGSLGAG